MRLHKWFYREYEGSLGKDGFTYGMKLILPIVVLILAWKGFKMRMGYEKFHWDGFSVFLQGMRPGVNEEAMTRLLL